MKRGFTMSTSSVDLITEWRDYYMNMNRLRGWVIEAETTRTPEAIQQFFEELSLNLDRVDGFYCAKEAALLACSEKLQVPAGEEEHETQVRSLREDVKRLYSYAATNKEGFLKIAKMFDKHVPQNPAQGSDKLSVSACKYKWDYKYTELQPRIQEKLSSTNFGQAEDRLTNLLRAAVGAAEMHDDEGDTDFLGRQITDEDDDQMISVISKATLGGGMSLEELKVPLRRRQSAINVIQNKHEKPSEMSKVTKSVLKVFKDNVPTIAYFAAVSVGVFVWSMYGQSATMNYQSFLVIWVTVITLTLLVWQWPSDCVMMGATLSLSMMGVITPVEAWAAFSNEVILSVAALSVVGDAVSKTGFVDILFEKLIGEPKSLAMAMLRIYVPCAIGAATISNTAVMACCMPAIEDWGAKSGNHCALFFMPISYIMLIAGTFAVFSTSTNLVAQGLLVAHDLPPLETFELAGPALLMTAISLVYLIVATPVVLKRFTKGALEVASTTTMSRQVSESTRSYTVRVQSQTRHAQALSESRLLSHLGDNIQCIQSVERLGTSITTGIEPEFVVEFGDIFDLKVPLDAIRSLANSNSFLMLGMGGQFFVSAKKGVRDLFDVVLDESSPLVGQKIALCKTFKLYEGAVVGIRPRKADQTSYHYGDQLIIESAAGFLDRVPAEHFLAMRKLDIASGAKKEIDTVKAYTSGAILGVMLVCVAFSIFPLFSCALSAIFALSITGCSDAQEMKKGVSLKVVLTIAGAFGLGGAIGTHGVAALLGSVLVSIFSPFGHLGLLFAVAIAVVMLGIIFHGTAVVALMFPLCIHVAQESGIPLHQMVAVLCYSVACQMLSPVSYNTNLMAFAACPEYTFTDFTKLGAPLVLILMAVGIPLSHWWFV